MINVFGTRFLPLEGVWGWCSKCVLYASLFFWGKTNKRVFMQITIAKALIISYILYYCHFCVCVCVCVCFCRQCKIKRLELLGIRFYSVIKKYIFCSVAIARNCYAAKSLTKLTHTHTQRFIEIFSLFAAREQLSWFHNKDICPTYIAISVWCFLAASKIYLCVRQQQIQ